MQVPIPFILGADNRPVENIVLTAGDIRFIGSGADDEPVNLTFTTRGFATFVDITDAQAADEGGQIVLMDQDDPAEFQPQFSVFPFVQGRLSDATFQIEPSTLKPGPLIGQRLVFVSSIDDEFRFLNVHGLIKANGTTIETGGDEFEFESVLLNGFSYPVLNFTSEPENADDGSEVSLEPGDLLLATVLHGIDGAQSNQLVVLPILEATTADLISNRITSGITDRDDNPWQEAIGRIGDLNVRALYEAIENGDEDPLPASLSTEQITAITENVSNVDTSALSAATLALNNAIANLGTGNTVDTTALAEATAALNDALANLGSGETVEAYDDTQLMELVTDLASELARVKKVGERIRHTLVERVRGQYNTTIESRE